MTTSARYVIEQGKLTREQGKKKFAKYLEDEYEKLKKYVAGQTKEFEDEVDKRDQALREQMTSLEEQEKALEDGIPQLEKVAESKSTTAMDATMMMVKKNRRKNYNC